MCIYVYVHTYVYIYIYICLCVYTCFHAYLYTHICLQIVHTCGSKYPCVIIVVTLSKGELRGDRSGGDYIPLSHVKHTKGDQSGMKTYTHVNIA